ncbi:hypothetical protein BKA70DRAFT_1107274 [Coprinopsis sp. MPI-PUGE-AT-0042]|nr:hypothetical protein BKA70DRAFT_1107274 [Coprinopsis sp. MPI-PUGE-AT-0042]
MRSRRGHSSITILIRVIVSNHYYAVELLQYSGVPRAECFCRFCGAEVETPEHVLLQCAWNEEIVEARTKFVSLLEKECTDDDIQRLRDVDGDCSAQLKALLGIRETITLFARYCYDVQQIVRMYPTYNAV